MEEPRVQLAPESAVGPSRCTGLTFLEQLWDEFLQQLEAGNHCTCTTLPKVKVQFVALADSSVTVGLASLNNT